MKRLSRHTVVVLLFALLTSVAGLSLAVVAFGQTATNPDATVPAGDYTGTSPVSPYTQTSPATVTTTETVTPTQTQESVPAETNGSAPTRTHGSTTTPGVPHGGGDLPSKATRAGPTHLAFTGGEPILIGLAGAGLMLAGFALHQRRRRASQGL
jgi:hypothetical protein